MFLLSLSSQWTDDQPAFIRQLKPQQGPLHVLLNSQEDLVKVHHALFSELYTACFGQHAKLAKKPKPFRISSLVAIAFGGWLQVREMVIEALRPIQKDPEVQALLYLLEELVPLVITYDNVNFRGGQYNRWKEATTRLGSMFIVQKRIKRPCPG